MTDALVSYAIELSLGKAISLATDRIGLVLGFEEDLKMLRGSVDLIRATLADAEKARQDQRVQVWLHNLQRVALHADNVLDELNYETLRRKVETRNQQLNQKVCFFFSYSSTTVFRCRMAPKVRDINLKLQKIIVEGSNFTTVRLQRRIDSKVDRTPTDSLIIDTVVGREDEESKIVRTLLNSSDKVLSVIPICGMGGSGKTTLAKLVCSNLEVGEHFGERIWVWVPKKVEVIELFKLILEKLTGKGVKLVGRAAIVEQIRRNLLEKKYLLVLDDIWNVDRNIWEDFFSSLRALSATYGNWCLVTTCLQDVASIVGTHSTHILEKLSDQACWSIVKEKAIGNGEEPEQLKDISQKILQMCGGLPLAASSIGGLLHIRPEEDWLSLVSCSMKDESGDYKTLEMCFDNLPCQSIKKCFAYFSIFPEDMKIEKDQLIELWMAEGFLQPNLQPNPQDQQVMEKIGDKYQNILLQCSLLEEVSDKGRTYYRMHNRVHGLAKSISGPESIRLDICDRGVSDQVRYVALTSSGPWIEKVLRDISASVHTLFLHCGISGEILSKLKHLHVLNLHGDDISELPTSIGKLIHLRYLDFSNSGINTLPESLCKLYNLETLRTNNKDLPKRISNLISLRHLHYWDDNPKFPMPAEMRHLACLQTLEFFNIGEENGHRIEELGYLKDLKGRLVIRNLELVNEKEEAQGANLSGKEHLLEVELLWSKDRPGASSDENVLEGLCPHTNLQKLVIHNFMGDKFPRWIMDLSTRLNKLVTLSLINCGICKEIPELGELPSLRELTIVGCNGLTSLPGKVLEPSTSLQELSVYECLNLESFPLDLQKTPSLSLVALHKCPQLSTMPKGFDSCSALRKLSIGPFTNSSNDIDWSALSTSAIRVLKFYGSPSLDSLPEQLKCLTTLTRLHLRELGIETLPDCIGNLESLERLRLRDCKKLQRLPDSMRQLTNLTELDIIDCPLLKERCNPQNGSEWCRIFHIPKLNIP